MVLDPNVTPNTTYNVNPAQSVASVVTSTSGPTPMVGPSCRFYTPPWPSIIVSVVGAAIVIYAAVAPNIDDNRRIFGVVLITLWTIAWALILWVLWRECHHATSWWMLFIPIIAMVLFFVVVIVLNIGSSI